MKMVVEGELSTKWGSHRNGLTKSVGNDAIR